MTDKIDFETDPPITPIKTVGFVNLKAGAAMTRYAEIEKALVQKWRSLGNSNTYTEFHSGQASSWLRCADELEAALALPEDSNDSLEQPSPLRIVPTMTSNNTSGHQQLANSKAVNAELYGLAIELCDRYMRSEIESLCVNTGSTGFKLEARKPWYQDEVNEAVRYISLREASGEPMPYRVVRDGDKVRFDVPDPPKDGGCGTRRKPDGR